MNTEAKNDKDGEFVLPSDAMIILPVRNMVLFPGVVMPVSIGRKQSIAAAQEAARSGLSIGVLLQRKPDVDTPRPEDLYQMGTEANIVRYVTMPDGSHHVICQGQRRIRVLEFIDGYPFPVARVERIAVTDESTPEVEARVHRLKQQAIESLELFPQAPGELANAITGAESPSLLADLVASYIDVKPAEKQNVLEAIAVGARLDTVLDLLGHRMAVLRLSEEIDKQTKKAMDDRQREFLLREQLKTIQRELGEESGKNVELDELRQTIAYAQMPPEAAEQAKRELARLERMSDATMEYGMSRSYLEWLASLPWSKLSEESIDIVRARAILDEDHFGLERVKKRIVESLAVRKLNTQGKSPILCLVGPPGVGKTSLGRSIARATGREFVRIALGGVHDEAEIRGHRRTYVGALPGTIIQSMRKAGTRNPVFMLDEIDKLGTGFHGDPAAALLELLDPEQNSTFRDSYLGVAFDVSKVMFIATANVIDSIPGPLRDRMEVIDIPGYTEDEKVEIARRYLVRRQLDANGLRAEQVHIDEPALRMIARDYTREAGCRNLEREIGRVFRNVAVRVAEGLTEIVHLHVDDVSATLGARRFENEVALRTSMPGVVTGLAWTPAGGDILFIEAQMTSGNGRLILTGQLGDVMKESAQAALTLLKARASSLGLAADVFEKTDVHIHVPAGAIPKDGPSAGVAMFTALVSLFTGKNSRTDVAMTGEISLRGLVLPIGGIKEKSVAALRAGIKTVLLPRRNQKDVEDIPANVRKELTFIWLDTVDDAISAALAHDEHALQETFGAQAQG